MEHVTLKYLFKRKQAAFPYEVSIPVTVRIEDTCPAAVFSDTYVRSGGIDVSLSTNALHLNLSLGFPPLKVQPPTSVRVVSYKNLDSGS